MQLRTLATFGLFWTLVPHIGNAAAPLADVVSVSVSGNPGNYQFSVGIKSPDRGCDQFADWWELIDETGQLIYRRVLLHSHVDEQPFTRAGGPVPVSADTIVWVRAHFRSGGYGGTAFKGSVQRGFVAASLPQGFAASLERAPPWPESCAF